MLAAIATIAATRAGADIRLHGSACVFSGHDTQAGFSRSCPAR
jgi:hypothetical protein